MLAHFESPQRDTSLSNTMPPPSTSNTSNACAFTSCDTRGSFSRISPIRSISPSAEVLKSARIVTRNGFLSRRDCGQRKRRRIVQPKTRFALCYRVRLRRDSRGGLKLRVSQKVQRFEEGLSITGNHSAPELDILNEFHYRSTPENVKRRTHARRVGIRLFEKHENALNHMGAGLKPKLGNSGKLAAKQRKKYLHCQGRLL